MLGFSTLGIKARVVALTHFGKEFVLKKSWTAATKSSPTMLHAALKNLAENPSGPGALQSEIVNKAAWISSLVIGVEISVFILSEIGLGKPL